MCNIKPIRTEAEYEAALARVSSLISAEPDTPEDEELDLLADLVMLYEYRNEAMFAYEGRPLIKFWIEERGWTLPRINELLDGPGDIEAVLTGEQEMSLAMAEALPKRRRIPVAALLRVAGMPPAQV